MEKSVVSAKDVYGRTPMHLAHRNDHTDIALTLIDRGADISAKNDDGETPLHCACMTGSERSLIAHLMTECIH